ncbi:MAG: amidohydrolase family protein [Actinobacteria bacterium]|nr:amidohydrolase family protein [Actinomycetota bacterium]
MSSFVDVLVHPPATVLVADGYRPYLDPPPDGPADFAALAAYYRQRDAVGLVHAFDAASVLGSAALDDAVLAAAVEPHAGALAGLGCVDPQRGAAAVVAVHDVHRMGLRGLFFHPAAQRFDPAGRRADAVWGMAEDLGLPVVVHCGATAMGAGRPGGAGIALDVADPMRMDRVAATHPGLTIVLAGVSPPWEEQAVMVAAHKPNVFLAPGRRPDRAGVVVQEAVAGPLAHKTMIGSGHPFGDPDSWLEGWAALGPSAEADAAVRTGTAARVFGLGG